MLLGCGKKNKRCKNIGLEESKMVIITKGQFYLFLSSAKPAEVVLSKVSHVGTELMRMKLI